MFLWFCSLFPIPSIPRWADVDGDQDDPTYAGIIPSAGGYVGTVVPKPLLATNLLTDHDMQAILDYGVLPPSHTLSSPAGLRAASSLQVAAPVDDARNYLLDLVAYSVRSSLLCGSSRNPLTTSTSINGSTPASTSTFPQSTSTTSTPLAPLSRPGGGDGQPSTPESAPLILVFGIGSLVRARRLAHSGDPAFPDSYSALSKHGALYPSGMSSHYPSRPPLSCPPTR